MFSTHRTFAAVVLSGLLAGGLVGSAAAQSKDRPNSTTLPSYKGTFPIPGQTAPPYGYPDQTWNPNQPWTGRRCDYGSVDRLARQLDRDADRFHDAVDDRYQRTNTYRQMHAEVKDLEALADRIHSLADRKANPGLILNELAKADRGVHRIDSLIDEMARFRDIDRDSVRTLRRRLEDIHDTINLMGREIRN